MEQPTVFNSAKPDWTCLYCNTRHGIDRDAAQRCFEAGPADDRGPLAIYSGSGWGSSGDRSLAVVEPTAAAAFTHEVLYGNVKSSALTRPYPQVNLLHGEETFPGDTLYGTTIARVPILGEAEPERDRHGQTRAPRRVRPADAPRNAKGWFGPIGEAGHDALVAANSELVREGISDRRVCESHHSTGGYPFIDRHGIVSRSYSAGRRYDERPWPDSYVVVAMAACGTGHPAVLTRWLHHRNAAVSDWLAEQFDIWVAGGDAWVPAFYSRPEDKVPGLRRAQVFAPLLHDGTEEWTKDDFAALKGDRTLGRRALDALYGAVTTEEPPAHVVAALNELESQ